MTASNTHCGLRTTGFRIYKFRSRSQLSAIHEDFSKGNWYQAPQPGQIVLTRLAILRMLNLSREQQQRIHEIRQRYAAQLLELRQGVEDRRDALREAIYGEMLDPHRVEQALRDFLERQAMLIRLEAQLELEFRQVLTPEHLTKFREIQGEELTIRRMQRELCQREEGLQERLRRGSRSARLQRPIGSSG